ncbi:MAG: alpha-1,2-fucosyltransferase, partial [Chitinophagaceae bacterium]
MIIVQLLGGLGNQLFQYAAARALAVANNTGVLLDTTNFKTEGPRTFDLLNFHVDASVATDTEINTLKCVNSFQRVRAYLTPYAKKTFYKQPYFHFDKRFLLLRDPVYIKGYFQSEKYFDSIKELIRKELVLRDAIAPSIANLASHMGQENSVSLHVRRGDYKVNKTALKYHGIVPLSYYQTAVTLMQQRNPD